MDVARFKELLDERDRELGVNVDDYYYGGAVPAIEHLYRGKPVKLFNGSVVTKVETVSNYRADYNGGYSSDGWDYAEGETFVVQLDESGAWSYFKITGFYDSWDNGEPDLFRETNIVKVDKVLIAKYEWKEV